MRYQVVAIGKIKHKYLNKGLDYYKKLLRPLAKIELIEIKEAKANKRAEVQEAESRALLKAAENSFVVCLDEQGKSFSSVKLADKITSLENNSISKISFLIGGAEGHSEELKKKADLLLSLSDLTLNHEMVRLILLEQIYRIETIRAGHPYHRD